MGDSAGESEFRKRMERIESLIQAAERFVDPVAQAQTRELVQALLDLHGAALERMLEQLAESGPAGLAAIGMLARNELVGSLLLLHGLHPLDLETRVCQGLEKLRPSLLSTGGDVELLGCDDGVVRVRFMETGEEFSPPPIPLKSMIEEAIWDKAPDAKAIDIEGLPIDCGQARIELALVSR
jgi:Fe-S cluster biogenesis protein NfuA